MENYMKEVLLKSMAAWGSAYPRPSGEHEWEPGCVHHAQCLLGHQSAWIRLNPFYYSNRAYDKASILQRRAFVDLVSLLSASSRFDWQTNREFWKDLFDCRHQYWGRQVTLRLGEQPCVDRLVAESSAPKFMIDFREFSCDIPMLEWCYTFLTASTTDTLDVELTSQFLKTSSNQEPRKIAIGLDLSSCTTFSTRSLNQLYQILAAYAKFEPGQDESSSCQVVQYVVTSLNFSPKDAGRSLLGEPQDYEILSKIMQLQSPRVAIQHLNLTGMFSCKPHIASIIGFQKFVQCVVRDDTSSLQEFVIGGGAVDYTHFVAICSALRYSTKLNALRIVQNPSIMIPVNSSAVWSWFALALMHPTSMSNLSALAIPYVHIMDGDADKAQQTLVSPHPAFVTLATSSPGLASMIKRDEDMQLHAAGKTFVTVKGSAKLRMEPKPRALIIDVSTAAIDRPLEVVVTLKKWTCVIVPGYGFGWVGREAILTRDERELLPRRALPLRSFMWIAYPQVSVYSIRYLEPLLELIGHGLTALYLSQTQVTDEEMARILCHCPTLMHLEIPFHNLRSLSFLPENASRWLCTLNLRSQAFRSRVTPELDDTITSDLKSFLTQPASSRLQKLVFDFSQDDNKHVRQLVDVLYQHSTLEVIDVLQTGSRGGEYVHDQFMTLSGQVVGLRSPSIATKLAFLSVIHQNEGALGRLDTALISVIFSFASRNKYRRVTHARVHYY